MVKVVEGENAWVIDNGIVYLCKVIKSIGTGKMRKFFIHYQGWKPKYDIWTDEQNLVHEKDAIGKERLMKSISLNPSTKVKEVKQKVSQVSKPITDEVEAVAEEPTTSSSSSNVSRRKILTDEGQIAAKKRRRALAEQDLIDEYSGIDGDYVMKIPVPLNIKKHLVDEWSLVAGNGKRLLSLPRAITVEQIIEEFLDEKEKKNTPETFAVYSELFEGLKIFFDKALPYVLLYRQEREQFDIISGIMGEGLMPSSVYGGEHLLRLFVRIQRSLGQVFMDNADMSTAVLRLTEFIKWLDRNKERFVVIADYILAEEALESLRSKTASDLIAVKVEDNSIEEGQGEEEQAEVHSRGRPKKSKIAEVEEDDIKSETKASDLFPVQTSPCGRPMRAKAGINKNLEM